MIERYALVAGRIRHELGLLRRVVERIARAAEGARRDCNDREFYIDSIALNLHDFYAGIERIFQNIASHIDRNAPTGAEWHRELLRQMSFEVPEVRPAVISSDTATALDEYLRFRHVVRNVYSFEFNAERVLQLADEVAGCFARAQEDLMRFTDFLTDMAHADEDH